MFQWEKIGNIEKLEHHCSIVTCSLFAGWIAENQRLVCRPLCKCLLKFAASNLSQAHMSHTKWQHSKKKSTLLLEFQCKPLSIASISPVLQLQISAYCLGCLQGIITWLNVLSHVWKMVYTWCSIWICRCVQCVYIYDYVYTCRCIAYMCLSVFEHGIDAPKQHLNVQNQHYNVTGKMFISQIYDLPVKLPPPRHVLEDQSPIQRGLTDKDNVGQRSVIKRHEPG